MAYGSFSYGSSSYGGGSVLAIIQILISDSGLGSEIVGIKGLVTLLDSGFGSDLISSISAKIPISDQGSGTETLAIKNQLAISDSGIGTETGLEAKPTKLVQDSGTGQDLVFPIQAKLTLSDLGSGVDTIGILSGVLVQDSGVGTDLAQITRPLTISDLGIGTDTLQPIFARLTIQDSGSGLEQLKLAIQEYISDSGSGIDSINVLGPRFVKDSGTGTDTLSIFARLLLQDLGVGTEKLGILANIKVLDSGTGSDLVRWTMQKLLEEVGTGKEFIYRKITWKPSIIDDEDFSKPIIVQEYRTVIPLPLWINQPVEAGETSDEIDVSELGSFGALIEVTSQTSVEVQIETAWGWETIDTIDFDDPNGGSQFYPFWSIQFGKIRFLFTKATTASLQLYCRT
jgi:hypothetical protein